MISEECNYGTNLTGCASVCCFFLKNSCLALRQRQIDGLIKGGVRRHTVGLQGGLGPFALCFDPYRKSDIVLPRFFVRLDAPLCGGLELELPEAVSRHVQVLRMQPEQQVSLFDGRGGEWTSTILSMGRKIVEVRIETHVRSARELPHPVTLAVGMPTNDRMDALVEKATELGACAVQPLMLDRSVLRLDGERALKKVAHWQGVAVAAAEQSGRTCVPEIHPIRTLSQWLQVPGAAQARCGLLSLGEGTVGIQRWAGALSDAPAGTPVYFLSGPEGGLSPQEEEMARGAGW